MPYSTPYLPLTLSASLETPSLVAPQHPAHFASQPSREPRLPSERPVSGASSTIQSDADRVGAAQEQKTAVAERTSDKPSPERRRSTLTSRFPLLRKGSRETAHAYANFVPSIHIRGSSTHVRLPSTSTTESPFLSTGEPRASTSTASPSRDENPFRDPSPSARSATCKCRSPLAGSH